MENGKTSQILQVSEVAYTVYTELNEDATGNNTDWIWTCSCGGSWISGGFRSGFRCDTATISQQVVQFYFYLKAG